MNRRAIRLSLACALWSACGGAPQPLAAHQPGRILGARDLGRANPAEIVDLVIGLRARPGLAELVTAQGDRRSSAYSRFLSPQAFAEHFGPSAADYARVIAWVKGRGLEIVRAAPSRTTLTVRGDVATLERAFGTELDSWQDARGTFRAPTARFALGEIADVVAGVIGLDTAAPWLSRRVPTPPTPARTNGGLDPIDLQTLYNTTGIASPGLGQTVAILGTGFPPDPVADVDGFVQKFRLATVQARQLTQVFIGGPNRDNDNLANTEYGENLLDIDMVLGLAPYANVVHVFTAKNAGGLFADGISFIVNQVPQAHAVSVSFGSCERVAVFENLVLNQLFLQAKSQGQQWFIASGDNGTDGCRDGLGNHVLSVDWPSSSPYTLGVGGTEVSTTNVETAWAGSGGGQSELNAKPAFQLGVGPFPNDGVRDVPDVAAVAGNPGVSTFAQGMVFPSQGTSAAAPIWAGVWSLIDQGAKGGRGIAAGAEGLYSLGQTQSTGGAAVFHDVTSGSNPGPSTPGYDALPGYDLVTGWGTPNTQALIANGGAF